MSRDEGPGSRQAATRELPMRRRTVTSFDEFHDRYQCLWVRYAHARTGSRDAAEQITDALTLHMARFWRGDRHEGDARHAWKVLKTTVARWIDVHGTPPSCFVETGAFDRVRRVLARSREHFAAMEESLGLYSAISRLPERQFDALVLHYVLEYPYSTVASLLGVPEVTVRSNVRHAKKRLARELGSPDLIENEA